MLAQAFKRPTASVNIVAVTEVSGSECSVIASIAARQYVYIRIA
jgi:hypothetical protein